MAALLAAIALRPEIAVVHTVVAPLLGTPAALHAEAEGVTVLPLEVGWSAALDGADVVCLAGYAKLVPAEVVVRFPGRMLNVHPALLPKYGGKGMWGQRVHEAVIAAGETESGCTVHLVDEEYDRGPILLQMTCPVLSDDTPESLGARVLALEHVAYPQALFDLVAR